MPRPVHFEIHASNPEETKTFYENVFGWTLSQWEDNPYWLINTGDGNPMDGTPYSEPGINGGMLVRRGDAPTDGQAVNAWVVTVQVPDCQGFLDKAVAGGASVAEPVSAIAGMGWLAYFRDPEGNIVGLMQPDPQAQ